ncbi:MAG: hypothetical protein EAZ07_04415 [Cytophagales bacterium]|nr:MAG: hypothetical protein EAZ07_04415 [Cytophagales bacterium]
MLKNNIFLALLLLFFGFGNSFSQDFQILPDKVIYGKGTFKQEQIIGEAKFVNLSAEKKVYQWYRVKKNLPSSWKVTTCVPGKCYSADKESGTFTLEAGKSGILDQNFFPNNETGKAEIELWVYEKNNKSKAMKTLYIADASDIQSDVNK